AQPATASAVVSATTDSVNRTRIIFTLLVENASVNGAGRTRSAPSTRGLSGADLPGGSRPCGCQCGLPRDYSESAFGYNWRANDTIGPLGTLATGDRAGRSAALLVSRLPVFRDAPHPSGDRLCS